MAVAIAFVLSFALWVSVRGLGRSARIPARAAKVYSTSAVSGALQEVCIFYSDEFKTAEDQAAGKVWRTHRCVTTCIPVLEKAEMTCSWEVVQ